MFLITGSLPFFAASVGSITVGILVDTIGRKSALLYGIVPHLIGWCLLSWNYNVTVILLGRMCTGFSKGSIFYPGQVYAAECLTVHCKRLRSSLSTWNGVTNSFGLFLIILLSYLFNYRVISIFAAITSLIIYIIIYVTIPESPTWLYLQGRHGDAEISQKKLGLGQPLLCSKVDNYMYNGYEKKLSRLTDKDVFKPLLILTFAYIVIPFCGAPAILTYLVDIIGEDPSATSSDLSYAYKSSVFSGFLIFVAHSLAIFVLPMVGLKKLAVPSYLCIIAGYIFLGYTSPYKENADLFVWRSVAVWVVIFTYHFGVETAPLTILGDSFPADAKRFASIPILTASLASGTVTKLHPFLTANFGAHLFYIYAGISLLGMVFVILFFYETVGKTLEEIQKELKR